MTENSNVVRRNLHIANVPASLNLFELVRLMPKDAQPLHTKRVSTSPELHTATFLMCFRTNETCLIAKRWFRRAPKTNPNLRGLRVSYSREQNPKLPMNYTIHINGIPSNWAGEFVKFMYQIGYDWNDSKVRPNLIDNNILHYEWGLRSVSHAPVVVDSINAQALNAFRGADWLPGARVDPLELESVIECLEMEEARVREAGGTTQDINQAESALQLPSPEAAVFTGIPETCSDSAHQSHYLNAAWDDRLEGSATARTECDERPRSFSDNSHIAIVEITYEGDRVYRYKPYGENERLTPGEHV